MLDVNTAVDKFSTLIQSRASLRNTSYQTFNTSSISPMRMLGEMMLNKFASQLSSQSVLAEQKENIQDEILENVVSSFALAGMLGIDLAKEIQELISLLESVTAEAS
jgi:hypothetical protein